MKTSVYQRPHLPQVLVQHVHQLLAVLRVELEQAAQVPLTELEVASDARIVGLSRLTNHLRARGTHGHRSGQRSDVIIGVTSVGGV